MKVLDLDMDYFMDSIATDIPFSTSTRLSEADYGDAVWPADKVRLFLEHNGNISDIDLAKKSNEKGIKTSSSSFSDKYSSFPCRYT